MKNDRWKAGRSLRVFLITVLAALTLSTSAQNGSGQGAELLEEAVANGCVGIAAGYSKEGETRWLHGDGVADKESNASFTSSTITRIASVVKPMTAVAVLQLHEQGKLDLNAPIQEYIPDYPIPDKGSITTKHLLQHTAGIGGYASNKERENKTFYASLADVVDVFKNRELLFAPGTAFEYSSYNYVVLGLIIERVSGTTYADYMRTNIWDKCGMRNTGVEVAGTPVAGKAQLYHRNDKGKVKQGTATDLSNRIPGGGIYSTVEDMLKFGQAILDSSLISASSLALMLENPGLKTEGNGYGMGWYLYGENAKYGPVFGHNGAQTGASALLLLLPDVETVVAVASNTSGTMQEVFTTAVQLFDVAAGQ